MSEYYIRNETIEELKYMTDEDLVIMELFKNKLKISFISLDTKIRYEGIIYTNILFDGSHMLMGIEDIFNAVKNKNKDFSCGINRQFPSVADGLLEIKYGDNVFRKTLNKYGSIADKISGGLSIGVFKIVN